MNYLPSYLPGTPDMYGVKQETPSTPQGQDLVIALDFSDSGISDFTNYTLEAVIKDTLDTNNVVWLGHLNDGITLVSSVYYININSADALRIPAGMYYLSVTATKTGATVPATNKHLIYEQTINIRNSSASVNVYQPVPIVSYTIE